MSVCPTVCIHVAYYAPVAGQKTYQYTDLLVGILARDTVASQLHQDRLGGHFDRFVRLYPVHWIGGLSRMLTEGQFLVDSCPNDIRVENKAVGDVVQSKEDRVGEQELDSKSMASFSPCI